MIDQLYSDELVDHAQHPLHFGQHIAQPTHKGHATNASCGDACSVAFHVNAEGFISDVSWTGSGCIVSMGAASMLSGMLCDQTINEKPKPTNTWLDWRDMSEEEILRRIGLESILPARRKCALVFFTALRQSNEVSVEFRKK